MPGSKWLGPALFFSAALLLGAVRGGQHARCGRIDVYSKDGDFDCRDVRLNAGAQKLNVGWRGKGMAQTGATAQARVAAEWREIWLELVPERDGRLQINFQGEYYQKQGPDDVRLVWVDDVQVTGARAVNVGLEELSADGMPHGWLFSGTASAESLSRDGSIAAEGKVCVAVWYGCQLRQFVDVRAGRPVRVTARFKAFGPPDPQLQKRRQRFERMAETYPQTVTVTCRSEDAAHRARLEPLPLLGGAAWAITSRWDDNNTADLKMRQVLLSHGHRGTFFLNNPARGFHGDPYGLLGDHAKSDVGKLLVGDGITVGGHSLTHPMLSYQNRNRMFREVLGVRVALESDYDTLVNAYAFSFCNYRNAVDTPEGQRDIAVLLGRAGYLQVANHRFAADASWPLGVTALLPADGRTIDQAFTRFLDDAYRQAENPGITFSMHTWYRTPEAWATFESELERYGPRPEWWHCNHNQYGAYRAQYGRAKQGRTETDGRQVRVTFQRPALVDLNDPVPLSFTVREVTSVEIESIKAGDAPVQRMPDHDNAARFDLGHARDQQLPVRIDRVSADGEARIASREFPGLSAALACTESTVRLEVVNSGPDSVEQLRVLYRLPLLAEPGVVIRDRITLEAGQSWDDVLALGKTPADPRYHAGVLYAVAQLDFVRAGAAGRLYVEAHREAQREVPSYPWRGFSVLGPIPSADIDLAELDADAVRQRGSITAADESLCFRTTEDKVADALSVEVIPVRGCWNNHGLDPCVYLLASTVSSPVARKVRFARNAQTVPAIWMNGERVGDAAELMEGQNELLLAYLPPVKARFSPEHAGPMFRIAEPSTGQRLTDIAYRP